REPGVRATRRGVCAAAAAIVKRKPGEQRSVASIDPRLESNPDVLVEDIEERHAPQLVARREAPNEVGVEVARWAEPAQVLDPLQEYGAHFVAEDCRGGGFEELHLDVA